MDKHYTLSWRYGIYASPGDLETNIGQAPGCEVNLPEDGEYIPEVIASIELCNDGKEWRLVRRSRDIPVSVNGTEVHRVWYLSDGNKILTEGFFITFRILEGELKHGVTTDIKDKKTTILPLLLIFLGAATLMWFTFSVDHDRLSDEDIYAATQSLIRIETDSLTLFEGDSVLEKFVYASRPVATGFVTTDSLLVTARHGINPWLNAVSPQDFAEIPYLADRPVAMALRQETENKLSGENKLRLVAYITLTDASGKSSQTTSEHFATDTSRDEIVELGDYYHDYFWRSISRRYGRSDMMLGDIAIMPLDSAGSYILADKEQMLNTLHARKPLTFLGFPMSEGSNEHAESENDELRQPLSLLETDSTTISMLAHGGRLAPGYSGGPALFTDGSKILVGGIVSVLDTRNGHRSYSVPASQVIVLKERSK